LGNEEIFFYGLTGEIITWDIVSRLAVVPEETISITFRKSKSFISKKSKSIDIQFYL